MDKRSGVSQRLPISLLENVVSNAERRALAGQGIAGGPARARHLRRTAGDHRQARTGVRGRAQGRRRRRPRADSQRRRQGLQLDVRRRQPVAGRPVVRSGRLAEAGRKRRFGCHDVAARLDSGIDREARSFSAWRPRTRRPCGRPPPNSYSKGSTRTGGSPATKSVGSRPRSASARRMAQAGRANRSSARVIAGNSTRGAIPCVG